MTEGTCFFRGGLCRVSHRQARAEYLNKAGLWQLMFCIPLNSFPLKTLDYLCKMPQGHTELQELSPQHSQAEC